MKTKEAASIPQKTDDKSRREFLVKAGKMALYIPPAMMVLMHPSRNAIACYNKSLSVRPSCGDKHIGDGCGGDGGYVGYSGGGGTSFFGGGGDHHSGGGHHHSGGGYQ